MTRPSTDNKKFWYEILDIVSLYKQEHGGESPTVRYLADATGHNSTSYIGMHLDRMVEAGLIKRVGGHRQGIAIVGEKYSPPKWLDKK